VATRSVQKGPLHIRSYEKGPAPDYDPTSDEHKEVLAQSNDPLIKALIQKLPTSSNWPVDDRIAWLKMLVMGLQVAYGTEAEIEVTKKAAN